MHGPTRGKQRNSATFWCFFSLSCCKKMLAHHRSLLLRQQVDARLEALQNRCTTHLRQSREDLCQHSQASPAEQSSLSASASLRCSFSSWINFRYRIRKDDHAVSRERISLEAPRRGAQQKVCMPNHDLETGAPAFQGHKVRHSSCTINRPAEAALPLVSRMPRITAFSFAASGTIAGCTIQATW
jgi:hypothetical protein